MGAEKTNAVAAHFLRKDLLASTLICLSIPKDNDLQ
jgi:hypothetical protein